MATPPQKNHERERPPTAPSPAPASHEHATRESKRAALSRALALRAGETAHYELSAGQRRLLQIQSLDPVSPVYTIAIAYHLKESINIEVLRQSINELGARHESLRTAIDFSQGRPVAIVKPRLEISLKVDDAEGHGSQERLESAWQKVRSEACVAFELRRPPLWRFSLVRINDAEHIFLVLCHHVVADRWSVGLVAQELGAIYSSAMNGEASTQRSPESCYSEWACSADASVSSARRETLEKFWIQALRGIPKLQRLPNDRQPETSASYRGVRLHQSIHAAQTRELNAFAARHNVTPFVVIASALAATLARLTGQTDLVLVTPVSGRHRTSTRNILGYFNNLVPVRITLQGDLTFSELLALAGNAVKRAFEHQDLPFEEITQLPGLEGRNLARCLVTFQHTTPLELKLGGTTARHADVQTGAANFDLALFLESVDDAYLGFLDAKSDLWSEPGLRRFSVELATSLQHAIASPDIPISRSLGPIATEPDTAATTTRIEPLANLHNQPQSETERLLILILEESLGLKQLDRDSHFFDLGGQSLIAARMFERISRVFGCQLPLSTLLAAPTPKLLAKAIYQTGTAPEWSSLVPIQAHGTKLPLYCVHGGGGNILSYRSLAEELGSDQPVWGLQAQGVDPAKETHSKVEVMAAQYVDAIRARQPKGPYALTGHSLGGLIALDMAQRLIAEGEEVPLLAIIDFPGPAAKVTRWDWLRWHGYCLAQLDWVDKIKYLTDRVSWRVRVSKLVPRFVRSILSGRFTEDDGKAKASWRVRMLESSMTALSTYQVRPYPGTLTLLRASMGVPAIHADHFGGWRETALGGVVVHDIPGEHMALFDHPGIQTMANIFKQALDRAQQTAATSQSS
jgi:thioesterase domain-containing protein